jgi:hypothetical protein
VRSLHQAQANNPTKTPQKPLENHSKTPKKPLENFQKTPEKPPSNSPPHFSRLAMSQTKG